MFGDVNEVNVISDFDVDDFLRLMNQEDGANEINADDDAFVNAYQQPEDVVYPIILENVVVQSAPAPAPVPAPAPTPAPASAPVHLRFK